MERKIVEVLDRRGMGHTDLEDFELAEPTGGSRSNVSVGLTVARRAERLLAGARASAAGHAACDG